MSIDKLNETVAVIAKLESNPGILQRQCGLSQEEESFCVFALKVQRDRLMSESNQDQQKGKP